MQRVVRSFLRSAAGHEGGAACAFLTSPAQAEMAAYPYRFGDTRRSGRSCPETVARIGQLPHSAIWHLLARGTIHVDDAAGLDSAAVQVTYPDRGSQQTATGAVMRDGAGFRVTSPPTPPVVPTPGP